MFKIMLLVAIIQSNGKVLMLERYELDSKKAVCKVILDKFKVDFKKKYPAYRVNGFCMEKFFGLEA